MSVGTLSSPFRLRLVEEDDWPSIEKIQLECYPAQLSESRQVLLSKWLYSPSSCFVAICEEKVVGYCLAHPWLNQSPPSLHLELNRSMYKGTTLYIHDMAIAKNSQKLGIAKAMLAKLKLTAPIMNLKTLALTSVPEAVSYWQQNGFTAIKIRKDLNQYGTGSQYMQHTLPID